MGENSPVVRWKPLNGHSETDGGGRDDGSDHEATGIESRESRVRETAPDDQEKAALTLLQKSKGFYDTIYSERFALAPRPEEVQKFLQQMLLETEELKDASISFISPPQKISGVYFGSASRSLYQVSLGRYATQYELWFTYEQGKWNLKYQNAQLPTDWRDSK